MLQGKRRDLCGIWPSLKPDDQIRFMKSWFLEVDDFFHFLLLLKSYLRSLFLSTYIEEILKK
jgi:hypothetical protein